MFTHSCTTRSRVVVLCILATFLATCKATKAQTRPFAETKTATTRFVIDAFGGAAVEVLIWDVEAKVRESYIEAVTARIETLEEKLTIWRTSSSISALNRAAGSGPQHIDSDLVNVLDVVTKVYQESTGAFDPTVCAYRSIWRRAEQLGKPPSDIDLSSARPVVGFDRIIYKPKEQSIEIPNGLKLDLGGVAKGYIIDQVIGYMQESGLKSCSVNAGGDIRTLGNRPVRVGIRNPIRDAKSIVGQITITNQAIATSGNYEQFRVINGNNYGHLIDPRSGQPVIDLLSATVIAHTGARADALATALFVLGRKRGLQLAERLEGIEAVLIARASDGSLDCLVTTGIRESFQSEVCREISSRPGIDQR